MSIECFCANASCRQRYSVPVAAAGKSVKCKACGETFVVSTTTPAPAPTPVPTDAIPKTLGRFKIQRKLGAGAFGTVYRAYDPQLDRTVALKVPHAETMTTADRIERFLREAKATANLKHPHIVPVFDAGKDGAHHYIASAFIDGQTLSSAIPKNGMEFDRAARIARELADALAYAHKQGIVHRDVKPANIMLDKDGGVHLMDFGLAWRPDDETKPPRTGAPRTEPADASPPAGSGSAVDRHDESKLTKLDAVMGTPAYMSPEQASGQKGDAQPAMDQYAAGVVLYELLTGTVPFRGPKMAVLYSVINDQPKPPRKVNSDVPKDLEAICLKAMSKEPEDRYEDCQEMADDLRRWLDGEPVTARRRSLSERALRWAKQDPKLALAGTAIAVVVLVSMVLVSEAALRAVQARKQTEEARLQAVKEAADASEARKRAEHAEAERDKALKELNKALNDVFGPYKSVKELREKLNALSKSSADQWGQTLALQEQAKKDREHFEEQLAELRAERDLWKQRARAADEKAKRDIAALRASLKASQVLLLDHPIQLAYMAHRLGQLKAARDILESVAVQDRGWEWQHLSRLCGASTVSPVLKSKAGDGTYPIAFSPDGTLIVAVANDSDNIARVWDTRTGKEVAKLANQQPVIASAFSHDGKRVVTAAFNPDGKRGSIAANQVRVWDIGTGESIIIDPPNSFRASKVAFNPEGTRVLTIDKDDNGVRLWDTKTGLPATRALDIKTKVAAFSPDGARVFTRDFQNDITVWHVNFGAKSANFTGTAQGTSAAALATLPHDQNRSRYRLITTIGGRATLWDADNEKKKTVALKGRVSEVRTAVFSQDEKRVTTASDDGTVVVWDAETGDAQAFLAVGETTSAISMILAGLGHQVGIVLPSTVKNVAINPNGERVAIADENGTVSIWDTSTGKKQLTLEYPAKVKAVAWNAAGTHLAVGLADGALHVLDG